MSFRNIFNSIDLIESYSVLEMTNRQTKVRLKYRGKINKLSDKLKENKINIDIKNNVWRTSIN